MIPNILVFCASLILLLAVLFLNLRLRKYQKLIARSQRDLELTAIELERREKRIREATEEQLREMAEKTEALLQSRFSIVADEARISCQIDWEGNCVVTRAFRGLKVGEGLALKFLDIGAVSSTPNSRFGEERLVPERSSPGVRMERLPQKEANKRVARIHFPDKAANQPEGVSYAYEYRMEKAFLMTKEEAALAYAGESPETEAFFHKNDISTRLLLIDLSFPRGYVARVNAVVLVNKEVHAEATKELKLEKSGNRFSLAVKKPLQGFE